MLPHIWNKFVYMGMNFWSEERREVTSRLHNSEPSQFAEKCLDPYMMNWYVQNFDIFFPRWKRVFIDKRDDDLF